jgi:3-oxoacyl-[acyl-carrier protein] reductase
MKKQAIVVGASGAVGQSVCQLLETDHDLIRTTSDPDKISSDNWLLNFRDLVTVERVGQQATHVDALVICAGKEPQQNLEGLELDHFEEMIDLHYKGPLWLVKQLQPKLSKGSGIVFISSVAAYKGSYDPTYASLKSAINGLTRSLARELSPKTTVNAVAPGLIQDSPVFDRMTDDFRAKHLNANLNQTLLTPDEVAQAVQFCLKQPQLTGQVLQLNGGQYFGN